MSSKVFPYLQDPLYFYSDAHLHLCLNFTEGIFSSYYIKETNTRKFQKTVYCRSQWPRCLRRRSSASRLLILWVRIPRVARMFVCYECCVLSGRGLCDGLITRPEESYRLWHVVLCNQETSKTRRLKPATGLLKIQSKGL